MKPQPHHNTRGGAANGSTRRIYLYTAVSVLIFVAVVTYNRATRPLFSTLSVVVPTTPRDVAALTHRPAVDLFALLEGVGSKASNGWLSKTRLVDAAEKKTRFRENIIPMSTRRINIAAYLSEASVADAEAAGLTNELVVSQRPSLNSQLLKIMCELRSGLEPKAPSCEKNAELAASLAAVLAYAQGGAKGIVDNVNPLPSAAVRGKLVGRLRSYLGGAAWEQLSSPVLGTHRYALTSAVKLPLWMCTGEGNYANPVAVEAGGKVMAPVTFAVDHTLEARRWNKETSQAYLSPLLKLIPTLRVIGANLGGDDSAVSPLTAEKATQNGLASEMLLKKVRIWSPLAAPLTEANVQDALLRPSLVCVVLTTRTQVKTAMLQHIVWGHQCDEFIVMYTMQDHEEAALGEELTPEEQRLLAASGITLSHFVKLHNLPPFAKQETDGYNLAWYRIRQACEWLDYWPEFGRHSNFYFATETVYAIPENMYALLMSPEYRALHAAGTPLYAGNRMVADILVNRLEKDEADTMTVPYIHNGAGVLFSATTIRLLAILLESGNCADGALTSSPDLFLAQCLATAGVSARDTADVLGEDRFHPLSPVEMLAATAVPVGSFKVNGGSGSATTTTEMWWLLQHKPKYLDAKIRENPLRLVSGGSVAFGGVLTPEQMVWMHRVLKG